MKALSRKPIARPIVQWIMSVIVGIEILTGFGFVPQALADSLANPAFANSTVPYQQHVIYQQQRHPNSDGIGKVYLGREIAKTMGHQGAGWLERPSRSFEEQPMQLIAALDLQPTDVVADIGAGTGYFSIRMSPLVPNGKILAVDIQPEMLEFLEFHTQERGITNIEPILGDLTDPQLPPNTVDLALMVDAYHEFSYPYEMMGGIVRSLKPGGRVALVEYRGENPFIPIKPLHKMTQRQVKREMGMVGLRWLETKNMLPQQHVMIFQKPESPMQKGQEILAP